MNWSVPENGSYSAALAAADALFSPRGQPADAPVPTADVSTAALQAGSTVEASTAGAPEATRSRADAGGGRILQAIDSVAPAPAESVADEGEPVRRRGRRPNADGEARQPRARREPATMPSLASAQPHRVDVPTFEAATEIADTPSREIAEQAVPLTLVRRRSERFSWVRKTLRPGEKWKRRLPKVAW